MQTGDNAGAIADFRKVLEINPACGGGPAAARGNAMAQRNKAGVPEV